MTVETKTTIELSDITTIEFECEKCHSISLWPLSRAKNPPTSCPCTAGEQWMPINGDKQRAIANLISLIQMFSKTEGEPYTMRFGLSASVHASGGKD